MAPLKPLIISLQHCYPREIAEVVSIINSHLKGGLCRIGIDPELLQCCDPIARHCEHLTGFSGGMQKKMGQQCHCEGVEGNCGNLNFHNMKTVYFLRSEAKPSMATSSQHQLRPHSPSSRALEIGNTASAYITLKGLGGTVRTPMPKYVTL